MKIKDLLLELDYWNSDNELVFVSCNADGEILDYFQPFIVDGHFVHDFKDIHGSSLNKKVICLILDTSKRT